MCNETSAPSDPPLSLLRTVDFNLLSLLPFLLIRGRQSVAAGQTTPGYSFGTEVDFFINDAVRWQKTSAQDPCLMNEESELLV